MHMLDCFIKQFKGIVYNLDSYLFTPRNYSWLKQKIKFNACMPICSWNLFCNKIPPNKEYNRVLVGISKERYACTSPSHFILISKLSIIVSFNVIIYLDLERSIRKWVLWISFYNIKFKSIYLP